MQDFLKEIITNIYPFNGLSKKQKKGLIKLCQIREYRPQEFIYFENSPSDKIFILIKGRLVALSKVNQEYSEIELIKRGTIFGIISFFTEELHSVSVKSIEKSQVLEIPADKFKVFLNKNPKLTISLSQIFSQRVKKRADHPKKIFQSKKIAITSLSNSVGKSSYLLNLSKIMAGQAERKIIAVQFSFSHNFSLSPGIPAEKILNINEFDEDTINRYIEQDAISILCVRLEKEAIDSVFALINYLSENYHFVLFELSSLNQDEIKNLTNYADIVYLLTPLNEDEAGIINNLVSSIDTGILSKLKIISCDFLARRKFSQTKFSIYATIPDLNASDYNKTLRRISRELAEKTVGVVLGSGLSFGLAHIGVLEVFEENKIPIDIISGSSIGALIGALWAVGYSTSEIKKIAYDVGKKITHVSLSRFSFPFPFKGFLRSKKLETLLKEIFGNKTFYDLKHTLRIAAFNFIKREAVVIKEGFLYKAVAASCSMPGVFEPTISKDEIYFDGGILNPLPVKSVLDYAKKIIAINITPSKEEIVKWYKQRRGVFNIFDFIFGSIETMQREFISDALKIVDVSIHPDLEGLSWVDFSRPDEFIKRGRLAALNKLEEIKKVLSG